MAISPIDLLSFVLALLVGLVVGLERTSQADIENRIREGGIRTFTLASIFGFFSAVVFKGDSSKLIMIVVLFSFLLIFTALIRSFEHKPGITTSLALLLVFLAGAMLGLQHPLEGVIVGLGTLILLSTKKVLHHFADILSHEELLSAVYFLTVGLILLPITYTIGPIHPLIGPGRIFDPMKAVLMILLVSCISFTSYLVIKFFGTDKGMEISAFIGGFVSSAAATASMSEKCKKTPCLENISTMSILLTNSSMLIKDYIIIIILGGFILAAEITAPIGILLGLTALFVLYMAKSKTDQKIKTIDLDLESPFALKPAVKFALIFSIIWASTYILQNEFGGFGVYAVSIGGLISTTSVSASMATMYASEEIGSLTALSTVLLAFALSSISKILIARSYFKGLAKKVAIPMVSTSLVTILMVVLLNI